MRYFIGMVIRQNGNVVIEEAIFLKAAWLIAQNGWQRQALTVMFWYKQNIHRATDGFLPVGRFQWYTVSLTLRYYKRGKWTLFSSGNTFHVSSFIYCDKIFTSTWSNSLRAGCQRKLLPWFIDVSLTRNTHRGARDTVGPLWTYISVESRRTRACKHALQACKKLKVM